jgi:HK97 family phage portal protein
MLGFQRWDMGKSLREGYEINEWVHACVNAIARHAATVPWRVSEFADSEQKALFEHEMKGVPPGDRNYFFKDAHKVKRRFTGYKGRQPIYSRKSHLLRMPDDPLEQLLEQPNPYNTRRNYIEQVSQHKLLGGNAFWVKLRAKVEGIPGYKTTFELWPLFYHTGALQIDADGQVPTLYRYSPEGHTAQDEQEWKPQDVIHFKYANPFDPIWGISPIRALSKSIDLDAQASTFQLNSMANRGIPDVILTPSRTLNPKEFRQARKLFQENRLGASNAKAPWIMSEQMAVERMSLTSADVDFIKTRGLTRQSVCSVYNVYPPVIAVMEGFGITAIDAILRHHWMQTVIPHLDDLMTDINAFLVSEFPGERLAWYDTSNVQAMSENLLERMRASKIPWSMAAPLTVVNDRLDLGFDLEGVVGADEGFLPAGAAMVRDIVEGNMGAEDSGNTNTPPDGGDPGEPGGDEEPNEPDVEDPDTGEPAEAAAASMKMAYFDNGHGDPHDGIKRWTTEEMVDFCKEAGLELDSLGDKSDNYYELGVESAPVEILAAADQGDSGVTLEEVTGGFILRFYHGAYNQEKRERLLRRVKSWGYAVD